MKHNFFPIVRIVPLVLLVMVLIGCQTAVPPLEYVNSPTAPSTEIPVQPSRTANATISSPSPTDLSQVTSDTPDPTVTESVGSQKTLPAFPGAEGFGANTVGGRGGKILEVVNLNDTGPGSLRAAIDATGPRIVVFRVAGTIELQTRLDIVNPYITIAGQTAPGGGITLKNTASSTDTPLVVTSHDVIVRYIRSRPGASKKISGDSNAIVAVGQNIIIDHCSFSWAIDQNTSTWFAAQNVTYQWSIISEGLYCSTHAKGCHSMGMLLGSQGSGNISIHHDLFAHNHERNPYIKTTGIVDFVNNVIYNSWGTPVLLTDVFGKVSVNVVSNYQKQGFDSQPNKYLVNATSEGQKGIEIFMMGNITPQRTTLDQREDLAVNPDARQWIVPNRLDAPAITTTTALQAYSQVTQDAGATIGLDDVGEFRRRDSVDDRIVQDVKNGTGKIIDDPAQVGGYPQLDLGVAVQDSDHDGMPDAWEKMYGFNSDDPSDGPKDANGNGYTNVEEYLNGTNPLQ